MAKRDPNIDHDTVRLRGWVDLAVGLVMFAIGAILLALTHSHATDSSATAYASYVALLAGGLTAARGIWRLVRTPPAGAVPTQLEMFGLGYKSFVAWRYLMVAHRKVRPITTLLLAIGLPVLIAFILVCAFCFEPTFALVHTPSFVAMMVALVFVVVVVFTLLQGPTLPWVARRLKVITPAEPLEIDVEAAPLEAIPADLLQAQIPPGSRLQGVEIAELRLPAEANVALIVRDSRGFVPDPATTLQAGDRLLVVAAAGVRERTERRLRAVSRAGRLAGWFGEHGL